MSRIKDQIDDLRVPEIVDDSDYLYQKYLDSLQEMNETFNTEENV